MLHGRTLTSHQWSQTENTGRSSSHDATKEMLSRLSGAMEANADRNPAKNPRIPAGYTYLGQLIAHDLAFHDSSNTRFVARGNQQRAFHRTPLLDLDSVYGGGPDRSPQLFHPVGPGANAWKFMLGPALKLVPSIRHVLETNEDGTVSGKATYYFEEVAVEEADLSRRTCPIGWSWKRSTGSAPISQRDSTAITADPRNDENLILSQLLVLMKTFHNLVGARLAACGDGDVFERTRGIVLHCFREIVVRDYLKRLLGRCHGCLEGLYDERTVDDLKLRLPFAYLRRGKAFEIPDEFWIAAFRIGHVMIQDKYRVNEKQTDAHSVEHLLNFTKRVLHNVPIRENWIVALESFFFDSKDSTNNRLNFARPFGLWSTSLLGRGGIAEMKTEDGRGGLIYRDLCRELAARDSQDAIRTVRSLIARARRHWKKSGHTDEPFRCVSEDRIVAVLSGLAAVAPQQGGLQPADVDQLKSTDTIPLLVYLMIEAGEFGCDGQHLGPLGSRLVGDTILAAIIEDDDRVLVRDRAERDWRCMFSNCELPRCMPALIALVGDCRSAKVA